MSVPSSSPAPSATAVRPGWPDLPGPVRTAITAHLSAPVAEAAGQGGGFTPGATLRLRLADGERVFVKAVPEDHPVAPAYISEAATAAALPEAAPAPRLRYSGRADGWLILLFNDIEGRHADLAPGSPDTARVVDALSSMARVLTPCPQPGLEPSAQVRGRWLHGWDALAAQEPADLGPWERARLEELTATETRWRVGAEGPSLVHGDIRPDNMLIDPAGGVVVIDWARASRGAPWQDLADLVPHLVMAGHSVASAEKELIGAPDWDALDASVLRSYAAAYAGYWTHAGRLPDPEGVPHLRAYQRRAASAARQWLRYHY